VTFGSFNKLAKISSATIALWADVLRAAPQARLVIKAKALADEGTRGRVAQKFAAAGIDPARLGLSGWIPEDAGHLAAYQDIDVALDTFPYNGTTTTCEALWMGVPVLTLAGRGHAARVSASLLAAAGLADWIAAAAEDFVARARAAADALPALAILRAGLREKMRRSPLCDARAHARGVEAAYRAMWKARLRDSSIG
jgi:predicted O-linked N-acetylglucosamine transferase (SPINDLY family)